MNTWIVKVCVPGKHGMWLGHFEANGRNQAKREARRFVSMHLPLDTLIVAIAQGRVDVTFDGPEMPYDQTGGSLGQSED